MPESSFNVVLGRVAAGESLSQDEMSSAIDAVMQGNVAAEQIGLFLTALKTKGETVDEIAGAAAALRRHMTPIRTRHATFVDTCGTGGDGSRTFNISTAAALVTAAAGLPVAKHGNRAMSSRSGSADVLAELGVNITADVAQVERCLDTLSICFCFAPLFHPAMKHVAAVRKQLGVPTIFNLLGPLANPAAAPFQVLGVGRPALRRPLAEALARLGTRRAVVVCGAEQLDEVTLDGVTRVTVAEDGRLRELEWTPADFGLAESRLDTLLVDGPQQSAAVIRGVLSGEGGPARDIVVANAAAALWTAGRADDPRVAAEAAAAAIDNGAAADLLAKLVRATNE